MGHRVYLTDQGELVCREAKANGINAVTVKAPATLAGDIDFVLPVSLPGSTSILTIDSAGQLATTPVGAGDLDDSYDFPTPGAGRTIVADNGALQITGADGIHIDTSGDGVAAKLEIESAAAFDAFIAFTENTVTRFELGYDDGVGGLVLGLGTLATPILTVADVTGLTTFQGTSEDSDFIVVDKPGGSGDAVTITSASTSGRGLFIDGTAGGIGLEVQVSHAEFAFRARTTSSAQRAALIEKLGAGGGIAFDVRNSGTGVGLNVDQNGNGPAVSIDSEATTQPLIQLAPLTGNSRGDIAFGTARTAAPSTPSEGDLWYDGTLERFEFKTGGTALPRTIISRYGPNINERKQGIVIDGAGTATFGEGIVELNANTGVTDDLVSLVASPTASFGDTVMLFAASGDTITCKDGTGNLLLNGADRVLNTVNDLLYLFFDGTNYLQIAFSNNP